MSIKYYGSLQNRMMEQCAAVSPVIGMGATELCYSDRHAFEVTAIKDERHITVKSVRDGYEVNLFLTKQGAWREKYADSSLGNTFNLGHSSEYSDPSF
ncbi:MAG: hypothetical protein EOM14_11305 [Clostridia bacterium]|nr:hypothetical protein [Clostridia bacterium]